MLICVVLRYLMLCIYMFNVYASRITYCLFIMLLVFVCVLGLVCDCLFLLCAPALCLLVSSCY